MITAIKIQNDNCNPNHQALGQQFCWVSNPPPPKMRAIEPSLSSSCPSLPIPLSPCSRSLFLSFLPPPPPKTHTRLLFFLVATVPLSLLPFILEWGRAVEPFFIFGFLVEDTGMGPDIGTGNVDSGVS